MFHNLLIYTNNFCFGYIAVHYFFKTFPAGWLGGRLENPILMKTQSSAQSWTWTLDSDFGFVNKQKVVKMFAFMIIMFGICWLPFHVYFIYTYHHPEIMKSPYIRHIFLSFYWLAMANCAVNPIIYYWMSNRYVQYAFF